MSEGGIEAQIFGVVNVYARSDANLLWFVRCPGLRSHSERPAARRQAIMDALDVVMQGPSSDGIPVRVRPCLA